MGKDNTSPKKYPYTFFDHGLPPKPHTNKKSSEMITQRHSFISALDNMIDELADLHLFNPPKPITRKRFSKSDINFLSNLKHSMKSKEEFSHEKETDEAITEMLNKLFP